MIGNQAVGRNHRIKNTSGGTQDAIKGCEYQLSLLELLSLKAYNQNLDFSSWTEEDKAGKFDDLILKYLDSNQTIYLFLQAKSKVKPIFLNFSSFFYDKNYLLYKYFESFFDIEANFSINYKDVVLKDLVICTNNTLPYPINDLIKLTDDSLGLTLHLKQLKNHKMFDFTDSNYIFDENYEVDNVNVLKQMFLAFELAKFLFDDPNIFLLKYSKGFLFDDVFEVEGNFLKFKNKFLNGGDTQIESFRNAFQFAIESGLILGSKNNVKINFQNFWQYFKTKKLKKDFFKQIRNFTSNENYVNEKIKKFLCKLLIVSGLEKNCIEKNILTEISNQFQDFCEQNFAELEFEKSIKHWLNDSNLKSPINKIKISNIFKEIQLNLNFLFFKNLNSSTFQGKIPVFTHIQKELTDFLKKHSSDQFLVYEVFKGEEFWGSVRLHQIDNSIIYISSEHDFEKVLNLLKYSSQKICVVIECTENTENYLTFKNDFMDAVKFNSNAKLIVVCDKNISCHFGGSKKLTESETLCGDLTDDSINDYLEKKIEFQGMSTSLKDLIDIDSVKSLPLKQVIGIKQVGALADNSEIYLPRTMYRTIYLKSEIISDWESRKFGDLLVFNENDYISNKHNSSTHLLETIISREDKFMEYKSEKLQLRKNNGTDLQYTSNCHKNLWKKSSNAIQSLRPYINDHDSVDVAESEFLSNIGHINIYQAIAGMGKSLFFQHIARKLKQIHTNRWIQNLDLQSFMKKFELFQDQKIGSDKIQDFFHTQLMKFGCELEKKIFENLFVKGCVILLFDGFDEVGEEHHGTVVKIIKSLTKLSRSNKFFISTRPEWCETLENELLEFAYSFHPFSELDQQNYLLRLWKKDSTWTYFSQSVLEAVNSSITDKEKSFTGVPLITKLIGEYFDRLLDNEDLKTNQELQKNLLSPKVTLFNLLNHFVNKKIEIYYKEKLRIEINHPHTKKTLKYLKRDLQKLSFKLLFPSDFQQLFPSTKEFDEETIQELIKCGLVQYSNGQLKFHHQTTAEFLVVVYFKDNINDSNILQFIFKVVLVGSGYKLLRSLINSFFKANIISAENKDTIKHLIPNALSVAAKESNSDTFLNLFQLFLEDRNCKEISNQNLLLTKDSDGYNLFFHYFTNCDLKSEFLDMLKDKFGLKFIKKIFQMENGQLKQKMISGAAFHGKNCFILVKWAVKYFPNDFQFVKELIFTKDYRSNTIFHFSIENFNKISFISLLNEIKNLENETNQEFLANLLLAKNSDNQTFITCWLIALWRSKITSENADDFVEIINWIQANTKLLEQLVISEDSNKSSMIHYVSLVFKKDALKIFKSLFDSLKSTNFLKAQDKDGDIFLEYFAESDTKNEAVAAIVTTLEWLKEVDLNLLDEIVFWKNNEGRNLFHSFCYIARKNYLPSLLKTLISWLEINVQNFIPTRILRKKDNDGNSFLNLAVCNDKENEAGTAIISIMEWLNELDSNLLQELILGKNNLGSNFIHYYCQMTRKKDLANNLKTLTNWLDANISSLSCSHLLREKDNEGNSLISFMVLNDHKNEAATAIINVLEWLKELDSNLFWELINAKNKLGLNFIHKCCHWGRKKDLSHLLKVLVSFLDSHGSNFDYKQVLRERDKDGNSFLNFVVFNDVKNETTTELISILEWLNELDSNLLQELIFEKNDSGRNLIHNCCLWVRKAGLPVLLKNLTEWLEKNVSNFNRYEYLKEKDKNGFLFLNYIVCMDDENEATTAIINILEWLYETSPSILSELIYEKNHTGRNLIHYYSQRARKKNLPDLLKVLIQWLDANVPDFNFNQFLREKDKNGDSFINFVTLNDDRNEANQALIDILEWLKELDSNLLKELVYEKDNFGYNLIHFYCLPGRKENLPILLETLIEWFTKNIPGFNWNQYLREKDNNGISFLKFIASGECQDQAITIFEWLKDLDSKLLYDLVHSKDNKNRNIISLTCFLANIHSLPKFLKSLLEWLKFNMPDSSLTDLLTQKNCYNQIFLHEILVRNDSTKNKVAINEILVVLNELDVFVYNEIVKVIKQDQKLNSLLYQ